MYILKNALTNITRAKGRNILIGIIIIAVTIGACVTIAINKSGNDLVQSYKENNPLEVSLNIDMMNFRNADEETRANFDLLDVETINKIGELDVVNGYYYILDGSLNSDQIEPVSYEDLFIKEGETKSNAGGFGSRQGGIMINRVGGGNFQISAYSDISYNTDFINGTKKIIEGSMIDKDNTEYAVVISEELAKENNLNLGDTIKFVNTSDTTITYDLKIVGIYSNANEDSTEMFKNISGNQMYTNLTVMNKILETSSNENSFMRNSGITSRFYIDNDNLSKFETSIKDLGVSDYYTVTTNEEQILETLQPIKNISNFSFTFLIVVVIVGAVVLTIIHLFNIRERKYEIGVLRAIGMSKLKVTLQLVSEIFIVALISLVIGTGIGILTSQPVTDYMLKNEIDNYTDKQNEISDNFGGPSFQRNNTSGRAMTIIRGGINNVDYVKNLDINIDWEIVLQLFGVSLILTLVSGVTAVMFVNKYEPNKILQSRG